MSSFEKPYRVGNAEDPATPVVWGDVSKLSALFSSVSPAGSGGVVDISYSRNGGSVRRYPGDPAPYTRGAASVVRSRIPRASSQTTPGRPFTVEVPAVVEPGEKRTVRQFTLIGSWSAFHAAASAQAKVDMIIRSPGGVPALIEAP